MAKPDLYALPLDEFTAARDEEAKRLRKAGDADAAKEVKALRKPSRAAWAINQAVRAEPGAMQDLIDAGERLGRAQDAALAGRKGGGDDLRSAIAAQGEAVERLTEAAGRELGTRTGPQIDRVRETLRAVAGDADLRGELESGAITRDHESAGFGGELPATAPSRRAKGTASGGGARERRRLETAVKKARHSLDLATKRHAEAERRRDRARDALTEAERAVDETERELRESRKTLEGAETDLGTAS